MCLVEQFAKRIATFAARFATRFVNAKHQFNKNTSYNLYTSLHCLQCKAYNGVNVHMHALVSWHALPLLAGVHSGAEELKGALLSGREGSPQALRGKGEGSDVQTWGSLSLSLSLSLCR